MKYFFDKVCTVEIIRYLIINFYCQLIHDFFLEKEYTFILKQHFNFCTNQLPYIT